MVALTNVLLVNDCNVISDYSKTDCSKCQHLKQKEESLMKEPYLLDDGLGKADAQLFLFRCMLNNDITQLHLHPCDNKSCRKSIDKLSNGKHVR